MARVAFPLVLQSPSSGSAIVGATATISKHVVGASLGSGPPATIFTSETGAGTAGTNQITTDDTGRWTQGNGLGYAQYWLNEDTYDIVVSGAGLSAFTVTRELASGAGPALVTALPASPYDGQRIAFLADDPNGVVWQFRYRAASASAYKWEFEGGSPMAAIVGNQDFSVITSYTDLAHVGPSLVLPLSGDFDVTVGTVMGIGTSGSGFLFMSYQIGVQVTPNDQWAAQFGATTGASSGGSTPVRTDRWAALTAATITAKYKTSGAANLSFSARRLSVLPVRVG